MNGKISKNIYVDFFPSNKKESGIYFLSENNVVETLPDHIDRVYTSPHIGILLRTQNGVDVNKISCLPVDQHLLIVDKMKGLNFSVTLIESMQKPGSVMYLFESSEFGSILYAGKCAYSSNFLKPPLSNFSDSKKLDCLYVHNTPLEEDAVSLSAAVRQTTQHIRLNPTKNVLIHEPCYREDILIKLQQKLQKKICVSENIMKHLELVGLGSDFTLNKDGVRIFITDTPRIKRHRSNNNEIKVVLIPRSLRRTSEEMQCKREKLENYGYKVIIYREHCTISELRKMVNVLNPKRTVLIGKHSCSFIGDLSCHMDSSNETPVNGVESNSMLSPVIGSELVDVEDENAHKDPTLTIDSDNSVISQLTVLNPLIEIS